MQRCIFCCYYLMFWVHSTIGCCAGLTDMLGGQEAFFRNQVRILQAVNNLLLLSTPNSLYWACFSLLCSITACSFLMFYILLQAITRALQHNILVINCSVTVPIHGSCAWAPRGGEEGANSDLWALFLAHLRKQFLFKSCNWRSRRPRHIWRYLWYEGKKNPPNENKLHTSAIKSQDSYSKKEMAPSPSQEKRHVPAHVQECELDLIHHIFWQGDADARRKQHLFIKMKTSWLVSSLSGEKL